MGFSGNVLKFDQNNNVEDFTLILSTKNYKHLGKLNNVKRDTVRYKGNLNGANEISFEVYKTLDGEIEECWDKIIDFKSVYVKELNEYFEIKVTYNDTVNEVKTITGTSLCEAELGQINIYSTEINTEADINRDDYVETAFYNPENPKASLLNRVLSFAKHYTIKYVDESLWRLQRSFSIDGTPIYDFLIGECAEQFNCLFVFNSVDRSISVYDLYSTCLSCGHRGAYNDICPECGSSDITYFGEDTTIFINKENLTDDVQFDTDTDSIKNCFKLTAGDEDMTTAIIRQNPNGTAYIYTVPIEQREDMSEEFLQKFDAYNELYDSYTDEYQQLSESIYDLENNIAKYKIYMMPEPVDDGEESETAISIAAQEAAKLTANKLSPIGLATLSSSTSLNTVDTAIKNYSKIYVNTGYVKVEILEGSTFEYKGKNGDWDYGEWNGAFKVTNYSNKEDSVITERMTLTVHNNYGDYCKQVAMKEMSLNNEEGSIFDVLNIEDINEFKSALELYCLNRLTSFRDAIKTAMTTLMGLGEASEESEWYEDLYVPYLDKLEACELEMDKRSATIAELESQLEELQNRQYEIQKQLNFQDYLGEELYLEFCTYKREQEYNNSNFISDGLDNAQLMAHARDFIETAKKELYKSSNRQHSISTTLHNLLVMPEFKEIIHKFALGNFIRVQVGKDIYRLRLVSYEIAFSDLKTLAVEFSDMTKTSNGLNDVQSVLQSASSMAKNYDSVSKQAEKGNVANTSINEMIESGLNSATIKIINNVNEDVVTDNNGILLRSWDDIENNYKPNQARLTHNVIAFTKNNWRSSELGIGEINYTLDGKDYEDYGIITKHLISGKIIAGDIYSANYNSITGKGNHFDLENGSFTLADSKIVYDSLNSKLTLKGMSIDWSTSTTPEVSDINGLSNTLASQSSSITANANAIALEVTRAQKAEAVLQSSIAQTAESIELKVSKTEYNGKELVSLINQTAESVSIDANKINLNGVVTANNYFKINTDGSMEATSGKFTGTIHASKGGTIGGFYIGDSAIYKDTNSISSTTAGVYLGTDGIRNYKSDTANVTIKDGILSANGANISGSISTDNLQCTYGKIGGWDITKTYIGNTQQGKGSFYITSIDDSADYWLRAHDSDGTMPFYIQKSTGRLYATNATIGGNITVDSGTVKGDFILTGKLIGRGKDNPNGTVVGAYETVVRGVLKNNASWGMMFIRKLNNANGTQDDAGVYGSNGRYYYPFKITGKGDLTIGHKEQFKVIGETGDVTISGNTTIDGECTASNINATGGKISHWTIENPTSNTEGGIYAEQGGSNGATYTIRLRPSSDVGSVLAISARGGSIYGSNESTLFQLLANGSIVLWSGSKSYTLTATKLKVLFDNAGITNYN